MQLCKDAVIFYHFINAVTELVLILLMWSLSTLSHNIYPENVYMTIINKTPKGVKVWCINNNYYFMPLGVIVSINNNMLKMHLHKIILQMIGQLGWGERIMGKIK